MFLNTLTAAAAFALLSGSAVASPAASPTIIAPNCAHDNCLRQFIHASAAVEAFCPTFTPSAGVALPSFASSCGGSPARVASACSCLVTATPTPAVQGPYLDVLAKAAGKHWIGTAADIPQTNAAIEQTDEAYLAILTSPIFGEITPANVMKVPHLEYSNP